MLEPQYYAVRCGAMLGLVVVIFVVGDMMLPVLQPSQTVSPEASDVSPEASPTDSGDLHAGKQHLGLIDPDAGSGPAEEHSSIDLHAGGDHVAPKHDTVDSLSDHAAPKHASTVVDGLGAFNASKLGHIGPRCNRTWWKAQWRTMIPHVMIDEKLPLVGDIYEFGVFNGNSLNFLHSVFPESFMWGFDSFKGLPSESAAIDTQNADFKRGAYASYKGPSRIQAMLGGPKVVDWVTGFYDRSLTKSLAKERHMQQALYIDIDADLYTSSVQGLDWMFQSGLVRKGTVIGYDDFWVNPCSRGGESLHPMKTGEGRAHKEMAEKYGVKFRCAAGSCRIDEDAPKKCGWGTIFIVEELGGTSAHGFEMSDEQVAKWKTTNGKCMSHHADPRHGVKVARPSAEGGANA